MKREQKRIGQYQQFIEDKAYFMKHLIYLIIGTLNVSLSFGQTFPKSQVIIPLNNSTGLPYGINRDISSEYYLNGFEIDNAGNFYFMAGIEKNCLATFSGTKNLRRTYYESNAGVGGALYLINDTLYSFNSLANTIVLINPLTGRIINTYKNKTKQSVGDYEFALGKLTVSQYMADPTKYYSYTLTGKALGITGNAYSLPFVIPKDLRAATFLGMWNDNFVFHSTVGDKFDDVFFITDHTGKILRKRTITNSSDIFGDVFAEDPPELRKVKNGNLYVVGLKEKRALITTVPLESFFK